MRYCLYPLPLFTDPTARLGILLTLLFFATFPIHAHGASAPNAPFVSNSTYYDNAMNAAEQSERRSALVAYLRGQAMNWVPSLSDTVRAPTQWVLNGFHNSNGFLSFGISTVDDDNPASDDAHAVAHLMQQTTPEEDNASWLATTGYHHRNGILPTHDALMMGSHAQQNLLSHYMQFDLHPYYGQNYFSTRGYYGTDLTLNLAKPADGGNASKPWGALVVGYTNGDGALTDHGRGIDLHGEVKFDDHLSLNSGIRQTDSIGGGDYVLLQWKLALE